MSAVTLLTEQQIAQIAQTAADKAAASVYDGDRWMRPASVAKYCDVHRTTVAAWDLPKTIIGGVTLYRKADVDAFLTGHKIKRKLEAA